MPKPEPDGHQIEASEQVSFGALPGYVGYQVRQAQIAVFKDIALKMEVLGVTPGEFSLLSLIEVNPGISQTSLVAIYDLDKSTLSHAINRLYERNLVERRKAVADRRRHQLVLTAQGVHVLGQAKVQIEAQEEIMAQALVGGERTLLLDMLIRIARQLGK